MSVLQTYQLWIGLGFALFLVIFLMVAFFAKERLTVDQRQILRFLCSLCAAFSGALITGDALFSMDSTIEASTKIAISGTAGFALFFAVWFTFQTVVPPADAFSFSVPEGWTFQRTVETLVRTDNSVANFIGFSPNELGALLRAGRVERETVAEALRALRLLAMPNAVRDYDVEFQSPTYLLRVRT